MHIEKVELKNFKRFTNLIIDMKGAKPKLVLLIGPNGCGKSSVFDAFRYTKYHGFRGRNQNQNSNSLRKKKSDAIEWNIRVSEDIDSNVNVFEIIDVQERLNLFPKLYEEDMKNDAEWVNSGSITSSNEITQEEKDRGFLMFVNAFVESRKIDFIEYFNRIFPDGGDIKIYSLFKKIKDISGGDNQKFIDICTQIYTNPEIPTEALSPKLIPAFSKSNKILDIANLSSGENTVFHLLYYAFHINLNQYNIITCIDEPEIHMSAKIQADFMQELFKLIPEGGQFWLATHSIGMIGKAFELYKLKKTEVAFISFYDKDFDNERGVVLEPIVPSVNFFNAAYDTALGDIAKLVLPKRIILCEGKKPEDLRKKEKAFDEEVYNKIFENDYPNTLFISIGGCSEVKKDSKFVSSLLNKKITEEELDIYTLVDKDGKLRKQEEPRHLVLKRREIENYLWDNEILEKAFPKSIDLIKKQKVKLLDNKLEDENSQIKDIIPKLFEAIIKMERLNYKKSEHTKFTIEQQFALELLVPLITKDTKVYKELEEIIFCTDEILTLKR